MIAAFAIAPAAPGAATARTTVVPVTASASKPHHKSKAHRRHRKARKHRRHRKHRSTSPRQIIRRVQPAPRASIPVTSPPVIGPDEQGFVAGDTGTQGDDSPGEGQYGGGEYDNARIADIALSKLGRNLYTPGPLDHGQCKQAVNDWVNEASGGTQRLGGNYNSNYAANGGTPVARDQVAKGDIIQLYNPRDERNYYRGMHTAVVLSHTPGSTTFEVVDVNFRLDRTVFRHTWDPYASAAKYGLSLAIWRMGTVALPPPSTPPPSQPAQPAAPASRVITVDNRVTNGGVMREDSSPARLTTQPWCSAARAAATSAGPSGPAAARMPRRCARHPVSAPRTGTTAAPSTTGTPNCSRHRGITACVWTTAPSDTCPKSGSVRRIAGASGCRGADPLMLTVPAPPGSPGGAGTCIRPPRVRELRVPRLRRSLVRRRSNAFSSRPVRVSVGLRRR